MNKRFLIAIAVVCGTLIFLIYTAVSATAKSVVTVDQLMSSAGGPRNNIRLGARITSGPVNYRTQPSPELSFTVQDIAGKGLELPVTYEGLKPDTLKAGRDIIVEGNFDGSRFVAKSLLTQCPSKYVPPAPSSGSGSRPDGVMVQDNKVSSVNNSVGTASAGVAQGM